MEGLDPIPLFVCSMDPGSPAHQAAGRLEASDGPRAQETRRGLIRSLMGSPTPQTYRLHPKDLVPQPLKNSSRPNGAALSFRVVQGAGNTDTTGLSIGSLMDSQPLNLQTPPSSGSHPSHFPSSKYPLFKTLGDRDGKIQLSPGRHDPLFVAMTSPHL